ncbi:unnamed protein product [Durusdinium trenchii]|uniref:non-reducing end alpha-L-arabinofuranosidase n=1 Tax=Durusdinium trenchii TaxID=1381693 RepID=A0ABP0NDX5_9DINO
MAPSMHSTFVFMAPSMAMLATVVHVEDRAAGPPARRLVGAGIEDVNHELYGGLYSQMLVGESFEEPAFEGLSGARIIDAIPAEPAWPSPRRWRTWLRANSAAEKGRIAVVRDAVHGHQSQLLRDTAIQNYGLGQQGFALMAGKDYDCVLWAKVDRIEAARVTVSLRDGEQRASPVYSQWLGASSRWRPLSFTLTSNVTSHCGMVKNRSGRSGRRFCVQAKELPHRCYRCSGGFEIAIEGEAMVDQVYLGPGDWGRFKGLPVRRGVAEAMFQTAAWEVLRLGGSMCNAPEYRWKHFRGPRESRQPWQGFWHPYVSSGFGLFEVLELCEAAEVHCVITLNNQETPEDVADFIEYCFASDASSKWGTLRMSDGRTRPYKIFTLEIGNEQNLTMDFVQQVSAITQAIALRCAQKQLLMPQIVVGQNIDLLGRPRASYVARASMRDAEIPNFESTQGRKVTEEMLKVLKGVVHSAWDAHIGGDAFSDVGDFKKLLNVSMSFFQPFGTQLVVLEENGVTHDLQRALNHARFHLVSSYQGDFVLMDTAANGLQVFNQNDNGWDQGQIMITPDQVWLSPYGWSQAMLSKHSKAFNVPLHFEISAVEDLELGAYRSTEGASRSGVGLRLVQWSGRDQEVNVTLRWPHSTADLSAEVLAGSLRALNGPEDPRHVAPRPLHVAWDRSDVLCLSLTLPGYALATVSVLAPEVVLV